jgi:hypothetical protein
MSRTPLHIVNAALICSSTALACPPESSEQNTHQPVVLLAAVSEVPATKEEQRVVDLAICLDTSGSMSGLIESAKTKIWQIVNDLALAEPMPKLRVALLTFGNDGHNAENGWVNIDTPFTDDLDLVSQKLFALTTNGGTELVGRVLKSAGEQLQWTPSDDALKLIVVAGNESADQDQQFSFRDICRSNISKGIMINSIYCGNPADEIAPAWKEVSQLADGHFAAIDQNNGTIVVSTPFDADLVTLSSSLNTTYIPYGARGEQSVWNQQEQDNNAAKINTAVAAQRAGCKASGMYCNTQWDLVDACKNKEFKLEDIKAEELPENMRAMTVEQRREHVTAMASQRAEMQKKITDLNLRREAYVEQELKKSAQEDGKSFDAAIRKAIRAQAESKGFKFQEKKVTASNADDGC